MIHDKLLQTLVCPENRTRLSVADEALVRRLNEAVRRGTLVNRAGQSVAGPIEAGLVRADASIFYPIVDDIPIMLVDEGIPLKQLEAARH